MKTTVLTFLASIIVLGINAQSISNGDLETWITEDSYEIPQGYETSNEASSQWNSTLTVEKTNDAYSGNWAAKLTAKSVAFGLFVSPGFITTGRFEFNAISQTADLYGGTYFPYRPDKVKGYFKYQPANSTDNCVVGAFLLKYSGSSISDTVGYAEFYSSDTVTSYTKFEADFQYLTNQTPDSLQLTVLSTDFDDPVDGSQMFVDSLSIEFTTGTSVNLMDEKTSVYPNPNSGTFFLEADKGNKIEIYDMAGKLVYRKKLIKNKQKINLNNLPKASYIVKIKGKDNVETELLQIN